MTVINRWWTVRGQHPRTTGLAAVAAVVVALGLLALAVSWPPFVFFAFELLIGLVVLSFVGGSLTIRRGGSLLVAIWLVLIPVVAVELLVPLVNDPIVPPARLFELLGSALYVGLGVAVPAGLLGYAAGVRSRTGPWESSLGDHLPTRLARISPRTVVGWTGVVALVTAALSVHLLNLGTTWSVLLLGGLAVAVLAGARSRDATEAVVVGLVTGAGLGLTTSIGISGNDGGVSVLLAWTLVGGLLAGLPIGSLGYLAGRALEADMAGDRSSTRGADEVTA